MFVWEREEVVVRHRDCSFVRWIGGGWEICQYHFSSIWGANCFFSFFSQLHDLSCFFSDFFLIFLIFLIFLSFLICIFEFLLSELICRSRSSVSKSLQNHVNFDDIKKQRLALRSYWQEIHQCPHITRRNSTTYLNQPCSIFSSGPSNLITGFSHGKKGCSTGVRKCDPNGCIK